MQIHSNHVFLILNNKKISESSIYVILFWNIKKIIQKRVVWKEKNTF